jgi:hypothetical protein
MIEIIVVWLIIDIALMINEDSCIGKFLESCEVCWYHK